MALDELDDRIANLPPLVDDPAYLVFADWLQSRGDPWGELISLQSNPRTPEIDREIDRLLAEHAWVPKHPRSRYEWHRGFLRSATIGCAPETVVAAIADLLARPGARMLEAVVASPLPRPFTTHRDW